MCVVKLAQCQQFVYMAKYGIFFCLFSESKKINKPDQSSACVIKSLQRDINDYQFTL